MSESAASSVREALSHFDELFARSDDPWNYRTSWYEQRKRDVLLAALPRPHFHSVYEPGCANGELSAALASRCESLLASDGSERAVRLARTRLRSCSNVAVEQAVLPSDWPARRRFDLVVLSEISYYLDDAALRATINNCRSTLADDWTLVACHWRHIEADFHRSGDEVHRLIAAQLAVPSLVQHRERNFVLDVWCADQPRSLEP